MPRNESQVKVIPELLDTAIADAGISISAVAREWATYNGVKAESKRRLLQKYLKGKSVPDEDSARQLARILRKPPTHFVTERKRLSREDLDAVWLEIAHIYDAIGEIQRALDQ